MTCVSLRTLGSHEEKLEIDKWWNQMKCHLRNTQFKDVMLLKWQPQSTNPNRGFREEKVGNKTITAAERSTLVSDMLEQIIGFIPEVAPSAIIPKATSLEWVYDFLREHYGCARTGRDMMNKFKTLERKPGERLRAYWSRYIAFYEENRIKTGDKLKIDGATATQTETQCRFSQSSELVLFLFMAHRFSQKRWQASYTQNSKTRTSHP